LNAPTTPLQADGLSRRVYPFLGLAIVGLVSLHGYAGVIASPVLAGAAAIGVILTLAPLAQIDIPARSGIVTALPVVVGFGMALYPLWGTSEFGLGISIVLTLLASALVLLPWERIPRYLHAVSPIGGLAVAFALEVQFGLSIVRAFPFVLLPLIFLALYYTTVEFAVGAGLAVADLVLVTSSIRPPAIPPPRRSRPCCSSLSESSSAASSRSWRPTAPPHRKQRSPNRSSSPTSRRPTRSCRS